mmetsp:Transcript_11035/g.12132  ORF Transcript_11035/g.12132 Transcript_11035/m.12132 type:complete len:237 (-) Transcript_11035:73-783(-)
MYNTRRANDINWKAAFNTHDLTPQLQNHLTAVYATLTALLFSASVGAVAHLYLNIGGILAMIATFAMLAWLTLMPATPENAQKRLGIAVGFGFFQGAVVGTLLEVVLGLEGGAGIILTAFAASTVMFACFSAAALLAKRRSYLYLGAFLFNALWFMSLLSFVSLFIPMPFFMGIKIYAGLVMFCGFVIFDTQLIVEKAALGDGDYVNHAIHLFVDFVAIFVRVVILLSKNKKRRKD